MQRWSGRLATVTLLIALALSAGCAGSDDTGTTPAPPVDTPTATPTATPTSTATPATPAGGTAADAANARAAELQEDAAPGVVIVVGIEWAFGTGLASIAAGEVTFDMINEGAVVHDIWVLRTEHAYDALPVEGGVAVTGGDVEVVQKVLETPSGTTVSLTANLEPGTYALICNIPAHYQLGMRAPFRID